MMQAGTTIDSGDDDGSSGFRSDEGVGQNAWTRNIRLGMEAIPVPLQQQHQQQHHLIASDATVQASNTLPTSTTSAGGSSAFVDSSLARQEQRLQDIFHVVADTNLKVESLTRFYETLSRTVSELDQRVSLLTAAATQQGQGAVTAAAAAVVSPSVSHHASSPRSTPTPTGTTLRSQATLAQSTADARHLAAAVASLDAKVSQFPLSRPLSPSKQTASRSSQQSPTAVTNSTTTTPTHTEDDATEEEYDDDDDDDHDDSFNTPDDDENSVHLWDEEERDLVDIHLPFPLSSSQTTSSSSTTPAALPLQLKQYGSSQPKWGIHSTIWDGGLALIAFLAKQYGSSSNWRTTTQNSWQGLTLIDLGSGTGLVGLAVAALSQGQAVTAVTDIQNAVGLLETNKQLNSEHWRPQQASDNDDGRAGCAVPVHAPVVQELTWGQPISDEWLQQLLMAAWQGQPNNNNNPASCTTQNSRILLTGADIVYRPSLFQPLLSTLSELSARLHQLAPDATVECVLACQSRFSHLADFWDAAKRQNFGVDFLAQVRLGEKKTNLASAQIELFDTVRQNQVPKAGENGDKDKVWIVRIHKLPYTFSI